jgi:integration host factor subunit beta
MVKADIVVQVARERNLKLSEAKRAVDAVFDAMSDALYEGKGIEIRGFASFKVKQYEGYQGRNPRTGMPIKVQPKRRVVFKPGAELRKRVDQGLVA